MGFSNASPGLSGGGGGGAAAPATPLTRANLLVADKGGGQWGSWGLIYPGNMLISGSGVLFHYDGSSIIATTPAYGPRFVQRSGASAWQTVGSWHSQDMLNASTGLQFVHEMDCIPFDDESNPCLANMARFYWGCWSVFGGGLVNHDDPGALHGCGVTFRTATDTNFYWCVDGGTGTLTRVDSGIAPADGTRYIFRATYDGFVASAGSCLLEIMDADKVVLASHTFTAGGPVAGFRINPGIGWMSDGTAIVRSLSIISQSWARGLPD